MIARNAKRPPVTYTSFQARDLGGDTAELVRKTLRETVERFQPQALLVGEACTASCCRISPARWPRAWASTSR
jgi:light-independent protochlorophyllide reductase subunit B